MGRTKKGQPNTVVPVKRLPGPGQPKQNSAIGPVKNQSQKSATVWEQPNVVETVATKVSNDLRIHKQILLLRKTISLLYMLTDAPLEASVHSVSGLVKDVAGTSASHSLSFEEEKALLETFTFICSVNVDPLKVIALCLQESGAHDKNSFTLKISTNHGDLNDLKQGLEGVILHLADTQEDQQHKCKQVLRAIVSLNYNRILCRLLSRHASWTKSVGKAKKQAKPSLIHQLLQIYNRRSAASTESQSVVDRQIDRLDAQFGAIETVLDTTTNDPQAKVHEMMMSFLTAIHTLCGDVKFRMIFDDNQARRVLLLLDKLARYVSAACFLVEIFNARISLSSTKIQIIRLVPTPIPSHQSREGGFLAYAAHVSPQAKPIAILTRVRASKKNKISDRLNEDECFAGLVNEKCAVHAEVQLLFHYELEPLALPPRLILSTKAPCYLCSLLFRIHGRYYTPKSHGRLYYKWTLPHSSTTGNEIASTTSVLIDRILDALAQSVRDTISHAGKGKLASMESLFLPSAIWASARGIFPARLSSCGASSARFTRPPSEVKSITSSRDSLSETAEPPHQSSVSTGSESTIRPSITAATSRHPASTPSAVGLLEGNAGMRTQPPQSMLSNPQPWPVQTTSDTQSTHPSTTLNLTPYPNPSLSTSTVTTHPVATYTLPTTISTPTLQIAFTHSDPAAPPTQAKANITVQSLLDDDPTSQSARPAIDVAGLTVGKDVLVDQDVSRGFVLVCKGERVFVRCGFEE